MSRGGSKISKTSYDYAAGERVSWIDELANKIDKASKSLTAVEVARYRDEISLYDQINSIVTRQPVHATVEDVVRDYHERTGLDIYLQSQADLEGPDKVASSLGDQDIFINFPDIKDKIINFTKNKIDTNHGHISVPAVQQEILATFGSDGIQPQDVENEKVAKFISDLIVDAQKQSPPAESASIDIGRGVGVVDVDSNDEDNTDFYKGLMPYMGQGS